MKSATVFLAAALAVCALAAPSARKGRRPATRRHSQFGRRPVAEPKRTLNVTLKYAEDTLSLRINAERQSAVRDLLAAALEAANAGRAPVDRLPEDARGWRAGVTLRGGQTLASPGASATAFDVDGVAGVEFRHQSSPMAL